MKTMSNRNEKADWTSVIWGEADRTLKIRLLAPENMDVAIVISDANRKIWFAAGWTVNKGMNEHTFEHVLLFATSLLIIQFIDADTNELIFKSLLKIPVLESNT